MVVLDNLCNSSRKTIDRVEQITEIRVPFFDADIRDGLALNSILKEFSVDATIHFAGLKAVGESVARPLMYFENNVAGTIILLQVLRKANAKRIVFSSSATVYGTPESVPIAKSAKLSLTNPYGRSKLMIEEVINDLVRSDSEWKAAILRYFNPVGAHPSGLIGEDLAGVPNNLMPFFAQVAIGRREKLSVFGNDYPTSDGTLVRD